MPPLTSPSRKSALSPSSRRVATTETRRLDTASQASAQTWRQGLKGSTNTRTVPPQASPTSQAISLVTPYSTSLDFPAAMASWPSLMTAPSTHPPETEPTIWPFAFRPKWLPTGRGDEPHVETTVAKAASKPSSCQAIICSMTASASAFSNRPDFFVIPNAPNRQSPDGNGNRRFLTKALSPLSSKGA